MLCFRDEQWLLSGPHLIGGPRRLLEEQKHTTHSSSGKTNTVACQSSIKSIIIIRHFIVDAIIEFILENLEIIIH